MRRFFASLIAAAALLPAMLLSAPPAFAADEKAVPSVPVVAGATALTARDKAAVDGALAGCVTITTRYYAWVPIPGVVTVWVPVEVYRTERTVCSE